MHFIKKALIAAVLPLLFISCGDDVTNNYYGGAEGAFDVTVSECDYETICAHKSYFDPDYVSTGYYENDFTYGVKLVVKLNDPSKRGSVNRLVAVAGNYGYDFNKQELEEAYIDSVGGYVFDFLTNIASNSSSYVFDIKLYDASNNSSMAYPLIQRNSFLYYISSVNDWTSKEDLEISLQANYSLPGPGAKAETHFLNSKYEEIGVYKSDVVNNKWKAAGVPAEAVYYYFVLTDKYSDVSRKFISGKFTIKDRLPDNVEFISEGQNPVRIEYLKDIDKVLTLSSSPAELILLNYEDNSVVWKKQLTTAPAAFAYSADRGAIYLGYSNGTVDSVNPADGSSKELFTCSNGIRSMFFADKFLFVFSQSSYTYYRYDFADKSLNSFSNYNFYYVYDVSYAPQTRKLYIREDYKLYAFTLGSDGSLSQGASAYYSPSSSFEFMRTFDLNSTSTRLYLGEGAIYNVPTGQNNYFEQAGTISPFCDMTNVSGSYFATVAPTYPSYSGSSYYPSSISVYNTSAVLQGKITKLAGTPMKVFSKDNTLKVYMTQGSGRLIAQKFTVEEVINSTSGKINTKKNIYIMRKL
jgi:hypothetical protein